MHIWHIELSAGPMRAGGEFAEGALDQAFARLTAVHTLSLDRATVPRLPKSLSGLVDLRILSLHYAHGQQDLLDVLSVDAGSFSVLTQLSALTCLSISGCQVDDQVPEPVRQLTTLKVCACSSRLFWAPQECCSMQQHGHFSWRAQHELAGNVQMCLQVAPLTFCHFPRVSGAHV